MSTGMVPLAPLPGGSRNLALAVSSDGSVITGQSLTTGRSGFQAFRWTESTGPIGLKDGGVDSRGYDISSDGSVIVGIDHINSQIRPIQWAESTGIVPLFPSSGGSNSSLATRANTISGNGLVVGGNSVIDNAISEAFVWSESTGRIGLGDLPGGDFNSTVEDLTLDGSVAVGVGQVGATIADSLGFIWTSASGMTALEPLSGFGVSEAYGISDDGRLIVGASGNGAATTFSGTATIWDADGSALSIQELLEAGGINMDGWQLVSAYEISGDGSTIIGIGINPSGNREAWRATINAVPEPSSLSLLGVIGAFTLLRRRRVVT